MLNLALVKRCNFHLTVLIVKTRDAIHSRIVSFATHALRLSIELVRVHLGALIAPRLILLILPGHARLLLVLNFLENIYWSDRGKLRFCCRGYADIWVCLRSSTC